MINLYSTGCPKCTVLKKKLDSKNIKYNILGGNMILKEIKKTNKKIFNSIKKIFE